jgi:hypothetical protein
MKQLRGKSAKASLDCWSQPRFTFLAELQDDTQLMAGIFQISSVELTRVIHNEDFWNAVRIPIVSDNGKFFPEVSF